MAGSSSSACFAPAYAVDGRSGIAVAQPPSGNAYPLVDPSDDIKDLIADLFLGYDDPADYNAALRPFTPPFSVAWLSGLGCTPEERSSASSVAEAAHDVDIRIEDREGRTVFDSRHTPDAPPRTGFASRAWGDRLHIYEWNQPHAVCRLVVHTKWPPGEEPEPRDYGTEIFPASAEIDVRAVVRWPKRVRSVQASGTTITDGALELVGGYNMRLDLGSRPGRRPASQILLSAIPGAGLGVVGDCPPPETLVRAINGVGPTSTGHFTFAAKDCYSWRQPSAIAVPAIGSLKFGNECAPCLDCAEVVETAELMNALRNCFKNLGATYKQLVADYHAARQRWVDYQENCAALQGTGLRGNIVAGQCPYADVTVQYTNRRPECVTDVRVTITMASSPTGHATQVPGFTFQSGAQVAGRVQSGAVPYKMEGSWPAFTAYWDAVQPGATVQARFRLNFNNCGVSGTTPYAVSGALTGSTSAGSLDSAAVGPVTLRCPPPEGSGTESNPCA